jgi:putative phosphoribosyl transferase
MGPYRDRLDAGQALARALERYRGSDARVLGMARGGVEVGFAVARALDLPLSALVVRKLGAPGNPELALGAVSETGRQWLDQAIVLASGADAGYVDHEITLQVAEARRRHEAYAVAEGPAAVAGKTGIVVDDGIATGASALVAVQSARDLGATRVVLATPVASPQATGLLRPEVDEFVVLATPDPFFAVGMFYQHFGQLSDDDVRRYLRLANAPAAQ